jgi:uncharacterized protein (TIRG00374 family)
MTGKRNRKYLNVKTLLGIAISLLGLYLGFRKFDAAEFMASLKETNILLFGLAMLLTIFVVFLRAMRWRYLLLPLKPIPLKYVFGSQMVCYFGNNVFPLRFGEILRSYSLNKTSQVSAVSIFGTVVIERLLDVIFFLLLLPLSILVFYPIMPIWMKYSGLVAIGLIAVLLIVFFLFRRLQAGIKDYIQKKCKSTKYQKVMDVLWNFLTGLKTLRHTPNFGVIVFWSLLIWVLSFCNYWLAGTAVNVFFSFQELLLIFLVTSAIISVPSAPGYVGTYHAGAIGILVYLGYPLSQAQVIAVILHAVGFLALTFIGFFYFIKYHLHIEESVLEGM